MAVEAGPLPWSKQFATYKYEGRGAKSAAKAAYKSSGKRWNPGSFHMEGSTKVWDEDPHWERNVSKGKGRRATWNSYDANGRVDVGDLTDDYKKSKALKHTSSAADYIDYSFNVDKDNVSVYEGCGHIALFEYNAVTLTLRVTFTNNGNVVAYFGVPSVVVGELIYAAKTKQDTYSQKNGARVHLLGVRFWDLIRIRGHVHGSRYEFAYNEDNGASGKFAGGYGHLSRPVRKGNAIKSEEVKVDTTNYFNTDNIDSIAKDFFTEQFYNKEKSGSRLDKRTVLSDRSALTKINGEAYTRAEREQIGAAYQAYQAAKYATPKIREAKIKKFNDLIVELNKGLDTE